MSGDEGYEPGDPKRADWLDRVEDGAERIREVPRRNAAETGFTSGKISHDPEPWVNAAPDFERGSTADVEEWQPRHGVIHDPRPEFDNHNPILAHARITSVFSAQSWLDAFDAFGGYVSWPDDHPVLVATPEQIAHARRVLSKLAILGEAS